MIRLDTLIAVLLYGAALLGATPLYPYLDPAARIFLPLAAVSGVLCDRRQSHPLSGKWGTFLSIGVFVFYLLRLTTADVGGPVANIIAFLLGLRLLTEKNGRHALQIFVLALFCLAVSTLFVLDPSFLVYLVFLIFLVTVGLVLLSFHTVDPRFVLDRKEAGRILGAALILPTASLLLMIAFFFILPRTQYPLWHIYPPAAAGHGGLDDEVSPGSVARIVAVQNLAFRAESEELPADQLYWRGIVMNALEGEKWKRVSVNEPPGRISGGRSVQQTIYPEPGEGRYLVGLDVPINLSGVRSQRSSDYVHQLYRQTQRRTQYKTVSSFGGIIETSRSFDRSFYLTVPDILSEKVRNAAREISEEGKTPSERIDLLERFFLKQNLSYATSDLPDTENPIDSFLFEKKRGYCEYFASSFALLLRLCGIPSRLVGGYYGGNYNEIGGYYSVTENMAHVWVEALVDGRWMRIDPSRLAQNAGEALIASRAKTFSTIRSLADATNYYWTRLVVTFDLDRQFEISRQFGRGMRNFRLKDLPWTWFTIFLAFFAAGYLSRRALPFESREARLAKSFRKRISKISPDIVDANLSLTEMGRASGSEAALVFAEIYCGIIYRDRRITKAEEKRLRELLAAIERDK